MFQQHCTPSNNNDDEDDEDESSNNEQGAFNPATDGVNKRASQIVAFEIIRTHRRVVRFSINNDANCLLDICGCVHIHVADSVGVS